MRMLSFKPFDYSTDSMTSLVVSVTLQFGHACDIVSVSVCVLVHVCICSLVSFNTFLVSPQSRMGTAGEQTLGRDTTQLLEGGLSIIYALLIPFNSILAEPQCSTLTNRTTEMGKDTVRFRALCIFSLQSFSF